MESRSLRTFKT